jgi:dienelactone hydrolase
MRVLACLLGLLSLALFPAPLPADQLPANDQRNTVIRHTDSHYTLPEYTSRNQWQRRADALRKQIQFAAGLLPLPEKTPLNPQVFGKLERDGYTIEKVLLETHPGFYLGGNLYRPTGKEGPFPGIVSPHGHWFYGRLENQQLGSIPARAINFARQGYVVFTYDMVGYNDTRQAPHGFGGPREALWGFGVLGLQLWNSIRAVDFLASLSDVDPARLAATGASGGATQTFLLAALDGRIRFAAPVNMVSGIMQGGSACENAPLLRIDTSNVEIAALVAPRPMLMVSTSGDWTRNTPTEEFPAVKSIYTLTDAEAQVENAHFDSPHNYHQGSREAVYRFFGKKILGIDDPTQFAEKGYHVEQLPDMLSLYGRSLPENAIKLDQLIEQRITESKQQVDSLKPREATRLSQAREFFAQTLSLATMAALPAPNDLASDLVESLPGGESLLIGRRNQGDRIPAVILRPRRENPAIAPTLLVHPEGTAWALSSSESLDGLVNQILRRGGVVMAIDAFQTGRARTTRNIAAAGDSAERYFTTFNRTDDANRIQDVLTALTYLRTRANAQRVNLVGMGMGGVWSLFARALADGEVRLIADLDQFDATSDSEFEKRLFIPGIRRAGDFLAASVLQTQGQTLLHNLSPSFPSDWYQASFEAAGTPELLDLRMVELGEADLLELVAPDPRRRR